MSQTTSAQEPVPPPTEANERAADDGENSLSRLQEEVDIAEARKEKTGSGAQEKDVRIVAPEVPALIRHFGF